ncbi:hypothetical protein EJ03DRAFT_326605 [Teratosphaeria nubilosa]|uniref:Uncharacterized protein n=1 Tax=Teratosphaeria nubilosa TaxID=161662 RepID=A0A6G1LBJ1_9PEZI|nr:hypothetical protein EJ03DRAFT_326605 [Teratosphaeria nubilosa]
MATSISAVPPGGITLRGVSNEGDGVKKGAASAVLLELSDGQVQEFRKAAQLKDGLQLVAGNIPKLRVGGRTIELSLAPDAFRNELYASTVPGSLADLTFSGLVSHRAALKGDGGDSGDDTAGSDAALAALKSTMASLEQEKQANHTNIVNSVLPTPKNRFEAARKSRRSLLGTDPGSPALGAGPASRAPTSEPINESEVRLRALRTPILHLLAVEPTSTSHIVHKTHIPKDDIEKILPKIARQEDGGAWKLIDRAYKDLDVWSFRYTSQKDRQSAIDNAVRAFDRQRIGKEEKMWQQLLPKEDRGKGIVLSRLGAGQGQKGLTPMHASSPMQADAGGKATNAANTPRVGASTPKPTASKGDAMKRLLSKDPKKRAEEAAKEQKRKERAAAREAAASAPKAAAKRQKAKKENPKIKSAEIVHSSDDDSGEEGEVKDGITRVDSNIGPEKAKPAAQLDGRSASSTSPDSSDEASTVRKAAVKTGAKARANPDPAKSIASLASKTVKPASAAAAGKATPRTTNGLSAPSSQHKSQRSPRKDSRPNVPSPLGAARPRLASDVSDRTAVGVQRTKQGAGTPHGLGITSGTRKRHDTVTSSASSEGDKKSNEDVSAKKLATNGSAKTKTQPINGVARQTEAGVKRKAEDSTAQLHQKPTKHRKTDSASAHYNPAPTVPQTKTSTFRTSPRTSSSSSEHSVLETITFTQGISVAEKFTVYYPAYAKMYDELAAKEQRGERVGGEERERLWAMHRRLEQMKREIAVASRRGVGEE